MDKRQHIRPILKVLNGLSDIQSSWFNPPFDTIAKDHAMGLLDAGLSKRRMSYILKFLCDRNKEFRKNTQKSCKLAFAINWKLLSAAVFGSLWYSSRSCCKFLVHSNAGLLIDFCAALLFALQTPSGERVIRKKMVFNKCTQSSFLFLEPKSENFIFEGGYWVCHFQIREKALFKLSQKRRSKVR